MNLNKKLDKKILEKYPNWDISVALRYLPIVENIEKTIGKKDLVLDVGSGDSGLPTYLKKGFSITTTDINIKDKNYPNFKSVKASAEKLPFKNNSFDAVLSVDMLEHLPENIRRKGIFEIIRVTKKQAYISFPRGNASVLADKLISQYYLKTHKEKMDFLIEHETHGLPKEKEVLGWIEKAGEKYKKNLSIKKKGNTNIFLWIFLLFLGFSNKFLLTNFYRKLLLFFPFLKKINFWPTYRVLYFVKIN
jgi:ubiquinone/menaquinone biosynthesis C-methylase UbiE